MAVLQRFRPGTTAAHTNTYSSCELAALQGCTNCLLPASCALEAAGRCRIGRRGALD